MECIVARNRQIMKKKTKQENEKLIVMSCTWKIQLSPNENQESQIQKNVLKNDEKTEIFFSCKDSLFSLGNYVWDEKWPSFNILSLI